MGLEWWYSGVGLFRNRETAACNFIPTDLKTVKMQISRRTQLNIDLGAPFAMSRFKVKSRKTENTDGTTHVPSLMTSQGTTLGAADAAGHWGLSSPARALVLPAIPCVEQKQEPSGVCGINREGLGARLLGEAKQLDRSVGGCTWYLRGNLSSSHHPPTMPPPWPAPENGTPPLGRWPWSNTPPRERKSICLLSYLLGLWGHPACSPLLPTPIRKGIEILFNIYLFGCTRSQLWHWGSSLQYAGFFFF